MQTTFTLISSPFVIHSSSPPSFPLNTKYISLFRIVSFSFASSTTFSIYNIAKFMRLYFHFTFLFCFNSTFKIFYMFCHWIYISIEITAINITQKNLKMKFNHLVDQFDFFFNLIKFQISFYEPKGSSFH